MRIAQKLKEFAAWYRRAMYKSSQDWKHYKYFFWSFGTLGLITIVHIVHGTRHDNASLVEQIWVFGLLGVGFGFFGLIVGYHNSGKKLHWSVSDVLWVALALFGLLKILQPIDEHIKQGALHAAATKVSSDYSSLYMAVSDLERELCRSDKSDLKKCDAVVTMRDRIVVWPNVNRLNNTVENSLGTLEQLLQRPDATRRVAVAWEAYTSAHDSEVKVRLDNQRTGPLSVVNLITQYTYVAFLLFAFGLRMCRAGADLRKSLDETNKRTIHKQPGRYQLVRRANPIGRAELHRALDIDVSAAMYRWQAEMENREVTIHPGKKSVIEVQIKHSTGDNNGLERFKSICAEHGIEIKQRSDAATFTVQATRSPKPDKMEYRVALRADLEGALYRWRAAAARRNFTIYDNGSSLCQVKLDHGEGDIDANVDLTKYCKQHDIFVEHLEGEASCNPCEVTTAPT